MSIIPIQGNYWMTHRITGKLVQVWDTNPLMMRDWGREINSIYVNRNGLGYFVLLRDPFDKSSKPFAELRQVERTKHMGDLLAMTRKDFDTLQQILQNELETEDYKQFEEKIPELEGSIAA